MKDDIIALAFKMLIDAGYEPFLSFGKEASDVVEKQYETAVGTRSAFVRLYGSSDGLYVVLEGTYYSEGRNVMAGCSAASLIRTDIEDAAPMIQQYIADAEEAVNGSYARSLFLKFGKQTTGV
jgi:hypothetical protein